MKAEPEFASLPRSFWAAVRSVSQHVGYTTRGKGQVKIPTAEEIRRVFHKLRLDPAALGDTEKPTDFASTLCAYYEYRAQTLNTSVAPRLMDATRAKAEFERLKKKFRPTCPLPFNKQKGKKKAPAYLTGIVNMVIEAHSKGFPCDYDPRELTTITKDGNPLRTLARRADGAFPGTINPVAIWEVKEYYYTTTFGSRVADGVYETLLDGMELAELREHEQIKILHYLMLDAHYTWWVCGKSYLCRIIDMLHMGYTDEVLFGYEVIERLPALVENWVALVAAKNPPSGSRWKTDF